MPERVLIVGSIAFDDIATPETQVKQCLGGSSVYGSVAASLFAPVDIVGVTGDDFHQEHFDMLEGRGVSTVGVERVAGGKTFHWGGEYEPDMNGRRTHFTHLGVFENFNPVVPEAARKDPFVFLGNIDPDIQLALLDQLDSPKLVALDSMDLWINIKRASLLEVIKRSNVVLINESEAQLLFETHSLPAAADKMLELGVQCAIIKQGSYGAQLFTTGGAFSVPAVPVRRVVDPTGAGDTFAGGFIGYLASRPTVDDMALRQAMVAGSALASYVVEDFSVGRTARVTREEIAARSAQLLEMLRCDPVAID